jgi:putative spermidine/putrescine transport system permease protein
MGDGVMMLVLRLFVYFVVTAMMLPVVISLPVAITSSTLVSFPPSGLSFRWFAAIARDEILLRSILRSFGLAAISASLAVAISLPCTFAVERGRLRFRTAIETLITAPRMIPQIVLVLALLIYYEWIGLAETFTGLVVAHLVIGVPFAFRTILVNVAGLDRRLEWSSAILGASKARTFQKIILPQLKTILIAAFIFTFVISFNNVTLALFLSAIGERTLPVEMFNRMYVGGMTPIVPAVSFVLALIGIVAFILLDRTIGVFKYLSGQE